MPSKHVLNNFRTDRLPHIWCPGCGHGTLMRAVTMAIEELGLDKNKVVVVTGIGCSSRAGGYMDFSTLHTTHGRALAFATGVKMANPDLHVIAIMGDGDSSAIGGNHLIHACRRNIDITAIIFNNNIYGMTGGQFSPTTGLGDKGTTAPFGNIDKPFDICKLSEAAGATYVARSTAYHAKAMTAYVKAAISHKGFAVVEGMSLCPTYYGRKNGKGAAPDMFKLLKDNFVDHKAAAKLPEEKLQGKMFMGEFVNKIEPEYTETYQQLIDSVRIGGQV